VYMAVPLCGDIAIIITIITIAAVGTGTGTIMVIVTRKTFSIFAFADNFSSESYLKIVFPGGLGCITHPSPS